MARPVDLTRFAPLRRSIERSRVVAGATFALAVAVTALAIGGVFYVERAFLAERGAAHTESARARVEAVRNHLDHLIAAVDATRAYFRASVDVTADEFRRFARAIRSDHATLEVLAWAPRVPPGSLADFMERARLTHPEFELTRPSHQATEQLTESRRTHYPVLYSSGADSAASVPVGLDLGADGRVRDALVRARAEQTAVMAGPVDLQPGQAPADRMIIVAPLSADAGATRPSHWRGGIVVGVFHLGEVMRRALEPFGQPPVSVAIHGTGEGGKRGLLHRYGAAPARAQGDGAANARAGFETVLELGGAQWRAVAVPQPGRRVEDRYFGTWAAGALGTLFLAALVVGYRRLRGRLTQIESANTALRAEIEQRRVAEDERARAEHALEILSRCNRALVASDSEEALHRDITELASTRAGFRPTILLLWRADAQSWYWVTSCDDAGKRHAPAQIEQVAAMAMQARRSGMVSLNAPHQMGDRTGEGEFYVVPVDHGQREPYGALLLATEQSLTTREADVLDELGHDLSFGISTLRLREQERQTSADLRFLAYHDPDTGLPNYAALTEQLDQLASKADCTTAVLVFELVNHSDIRYGLGLGAAWDVITQAAARLASALSPMLGPALIETRQLAAVLQVPSTDTAWAVVHRGLAALDAPIETEGARVLVRSRAGVALREQADADSGELVRAAANALLTTGGAQRVVAYTREHEAKHAHHVRLLPELHNAIANRALTLHFQPKVDTATGRTVGLEGLVRWYRDDGTVVPPGDFIPLAERTGLIGSLTESVVGAGICWLEAWHAEGVAVPVALNVSMRDLARSDFVDFVRNRLEQANVPAELLELEVTEEAFMEEAAAVTQTLHELRTLGVSLSVDDFGTGYSSLAYLKDLPVSRLKIDRTFVQGMVDGSKDATIVRSALQIAEGMGLGAVAEGVEDPALMDTLASMGCAHAQGFGIAAPMPATDLRPWLDAER